MAIIVYNRKVEDHTANLNNYPIYRPNVLGNPYTEIKDKHTLASYICKTREEAINKYSHYFDIMYGNNIAFTKIVDEIYEKYKNGVDVYLECYCKKYSSDDKTAHNDEVTCHGDIIRNKLQARLIKEKIEELKVKTLY